MKQILYVNARTASQLQNLCAQHGLSLAQGKPRKEAREKFLCELIDLLGSEITEDLIVGGTIDIKVVPTNVIPVLFQYPSELEKI